MTEDRLWFRAKRYGWGWYPVTWQGWVVTLLYVALVTVTISEVEKLGLLDPVNVIVITLACLGHTLLLMGICFKTGERPRWRWGK